MDPKCLCICIYIYIYIYIYIHMVPNVTGTSAPTLSPLPERYVHYLNVNEFQLSISIPCGRMVWYHKFHTRKLRKYRPFWIGFNELLAVKGRRKILDICAPHWYTLRVPCISVMSPVTFSKIQAAKSQSVHKWAALVCNISESFKCAINYGSYLSWTLVLKCISWCRSIKLSP